MTPETRQRENFRRFLDDIRKTPDERAVADAVQDLVEGIEEGEATERVTYRPIPTQITYRTETQRVCGSLIALCNDGRIYELIDGATAWNEVEGPR